MYTSLEAKLHDIFWNAEDDGSELALLRNFYLSEGNLEVGCGSGRLLLPLLEEGLFIDGVEISRDMLDLCQQKATQLTIAPHLHHGDILDFSLETAAWQPAPYQRIAIPAFTLQLISRVHTIKLFKHLATLSTDDAKLYFSTFIPWAEITGELEENTWYRDHKTQTPSNQSATCSTKFTIHRLNQTLHRHHRYQLIYSDDAPPVTHESQQKLTWFTFPELHLLLDAAGWQVETLITDFTPSAEPDPDTHIITIIAHKR